MHLSSRLFPLLLLSSSALPACVPSSRPTPSSTATAPRPDSRAAAERGDLRSERLRVAFGDPHELASVLRQLFDAGSARAEVAAILVDHTTGELVVLGTEGGLRAVHKLVDSVNHHEPASEPTIEVVMLEHADAREVARVLQPMLPGDLKITADHPTNSLVIKGPTDQRQTVKKLAAALDTSKRTN